MNKRLAFTLAEVLITLTIIAIVAVITLPNIVANVQKFVLKNQLKKVVANFYSAIQQVKLNTYPELECYYWEKGKYVTKCIEENEYGTCKAWTLDDGSPIPADVNGKFNQCTVFDDVLFNKVFKVTKFCRNNALAKGCLTDKYRGIDKVKAEQNPNITPDPNEHMTDAWLRNIHPVWILSDGTVVIRYGNCVGYRAPIYVVDVNGHKGPNKWGYDIFGLQLKGNEQAGISKIVGYDFATEKGGTSSTAIIQDLFKD